MFLNTILEFKLSISNNDNIDDDYISCFKEIFHHKKVWLFYFIKDLKLPCYIKRKIEDTKNKETRPNTKQKVVKVFMFW